MHISPSFTLSYIITHYPSLLCVCFEKFLANFRRTTLPQSHQKFATESANKKVCRKFAATSPFYCKKQFYLLSVFTELWLLIGFDYIHIYIHLCPCFKNCTPPLTRNPRPDIELRLLGLKVLFIITR